MSIGGIIMGIVSLVIVGVVLAFLALLVVSWIILTIKVVAIVLNAITTFTLPKVYETLILGLWLLINVTLLS